MYSLIVEPPVLLKNAVLVPSYKLFLCSERNNHIYLYFECSIILSYRHNEDLHNLYSFQNINISNYQILKDYSPWSWLIGGLVFFQHQLGGAKEYRTKVSQGRLAYGFKHWASV